MSITFTDPKLYLKGTSTAYLQDSDGNYVYWSDKFQSASITTSVTMGEIRGGIGNPVLMTLPTDSTLNVSFTAADFSLFAKAAQMGAKVTSGAPVLKCGTGTVTGTTLYLPDGASAVAPVGCSDPLCWIREGNNGNISGFQPNGSKAYLVSPNGSVKGFTAGNHTYTVWYYENQSNAKIATISSLFSPAVYRFTAELPVYTSNGAANQGDLAGILTVIVPRLKLGGDNGGITGDQTNPDTTIINGMALADDGAAGSTGCAGACSLSSSPLAYYVYAPCNSASGVEGILGALGGEITVTTGSTVQLTPAVIVDGTLVYNYNPANMSYQSSATGKATVSSSGLVSGVSAGDAEITVTYTLGGTQGTYTDYVNVTVTSA